MDKWKYKIVKGAMSEKDLNILGCQGWELVAVTETNRTTIKWIFKQEVL